VIPAKPCRTINPDTLPLMATLPTTDPGHRGLSHGQLRAYCADSLQRLARQTPAPSAPVADPVHRGLSFAQLLGYAADAAQTLATH